MVYRSRRRKFNDFVRTRNWKYYLIFLIIFITIVALVVIIASKSDTKDLPENTTTTLNQSEESATTLDSDDNVKGKYLISINTANNIVSIYGWDSDTDKFSSSPIKEMPAALPENMAEEQYTFQKEDLSKDIWYKVSNNEFYRYYSDFGGIFNFHTARYTGNGNKNSLDTDSYNSIGKASSENGIVLLCSDARWIYENCSYASEIVVESDESAASEDIISSIIPIPEGLSWDPTDTAEDSPFCQTRLKEFNCTIQYATLPVGVGTEPLNKFLKAYDENGADISSYVYTTWEGDFTSAGVYDVYFYVADIYGNVLTDSINVKVVQPEPETTTSDAEENTDENTSKENTTEETSEVNNTSEAASEVNTEETVSEVSTSEATEEASKETTEGTS